MKAPARATLVVDSGVCLPFTRPAAKHDAIALGANAGPRRRLELAGAAPPTAGTRRKAQRPALPVDSTLPRLLTTAEVATLFRTSPSSLRDWREKGYGPAWFKTGKNVVYRESVVLAWIDQQENPAFAAGATTRRSA